MLEEVMWRFVEFSQGKKRIPMLTERTGITGKGLSRGFTRSFRPSTIERARASAERYLNDLLEKNGYTEKERQIWIDNHPGSLAEGMIYETEIAGEIEYPLTRNLARRMGELGVAYRKAKETRDLEGAKDLLLSTGWLDARYFTNALAEKELNIRPRLLDTVAAASDWNALARPVGAITANALLSLLALWDVEFSAIHFTRLRARSVFVLLMPWADIPNDAKEFVPKRGMFRFPITRLIDLSYALAYLHQHDKWPDRRPTVKELAIRCAETEQNLVQWRDGTKFFRWQHFQNTWEALFPDRMYGGKPSRVRPLSPLYVAAAIFQISMVKVDTNSPEKEVGIADDEYLYWRRIHLEQFQQTSGATFGDIHWPSWLTNS